MKRFLLIQIIILTVCLLSACSAKPLVVEGTAMKPSFNDGDRILVDKNLRELKRGDLITFLYPTKKIEEHQYFVLGDNRDNSSDSRYWGTVDEKLMTGKYTMTYSKAQ